MKVNPDKIGVLDFLIGVLTLHEKELDALLNRLEKQAQEFAERGR